MRLLDTTLLSLAAAVLIIGVHQTMTLGLTHSYWLLMLASGLLLWYIFRKRTMKPEEPPPATKRPKSKKRKR